MSCTITAQESVTHNVASIWEDRFDTTAMPVDSVGPSRVEFKEWVLRERGVAARALELSAKRNVNTNISAAQLTLNQLRYTRMPQGLGGWQA